MIARAIFRPAAELELQEAHDWYEQRAPGLGAEFMRCIDSCVQRIRRQPEMYPEVHKRVRQGVVRRFPYSIFYVVAINEIIVISVFHASRDRRYGKGAHDEFYFHLLVPKLCSRFHLALIPACVRGACLSHISALTR
jgi:plasmid stabilization system protein ParE